MSAPALTGRPELRPRPESLTDLFWSFTALALQGFGGVMAVVQRELVDKKRWLTREEFLEDWAVAQIMPGPNVVNLSLLLGDRYFGLRGSLVAVAGMFTFPLAGLLALAITFASVADWPIAEGALRGLGAAAAGLVLASGFRLIPALRSNPIGVPACAVLALLTFGAIALMRWPLIWVLLPVGSIACVWAWVRLGQLGDAPSGSGTP